MFIFSVFLWQWVQAVFTIWVFLRETKFCRIPYAFLSSFWNCQTKNFYKRNAYYYFCSKDDGRHDKGCGRVKYSLNGFYEEYSEVKKGDFSMVSIDGLGEKVKFIINDSDLERFRWVYKNMREKGIYSDEDLLFPGLYIVKNLSIEEMIDKFLEGYMYTLVKTSLFVDYSSGEKLNKDFMRLLSILPTSLQARGYTNESTYAFIFIYFFDLFSYFPNLLWQYFKIYMFFWIKRFFSIFPANRRETLHSFFSTISKSLNYCDNSLKMAYNKKGVHFVCKRMKIDDSLFVHNSENEKIFVFKKVKKGDIGTLKYKVNMDDIVLKYQELDLERFNIFVFINEVQRFRMMKESFVVLDNVQSRLRWIEEEQCYPYVRKGDIGYHMSNYDELAEILKEGFVRSWSDKSIWVSDEQIFIDRRALVLMNSMFFNSFEIKKRFFGYLKSTSLESLTSIVRSVSLKRGRRQDKTIKNSFWKRLMVDSNLFLEADNQSLITLVDLKRIGVSDKAKSFLKGEIDVICPPQISIVENLKEFEPPKFNPKPNIKKVKDFLKIRKEETKSSLIQGLMGKLQTKGTGIYLKKYGGKPVEEIKAKVEENREKVQKTYKSVLLEMNMKEIPSKKCNEFFSKGELLNFKLKERGGERSKASELQENAGDTIKCCENILKDVFKIKKIFPDVPAVKGLIKRKKWMTDRDMAKALFGSEADKVSNNDIQKLNRKEINLYSTKKVLFLDKLKDNIKSFNDKNPYELLRDMDEEAKNRERSFLKIDKIHSKALKINGMNKECKIKSDIRREGKLDKISKRGEVGKSCKSENIKEIKYYIKSKRIKSSEIDKLVLSNINFSKSIKANVSNKYFELKKNYIANPTKLMLSEFRGEKIKANYSDKSIGKAKFESLHLNLANKIDITNKEIFNVMTEELNIEQLTELAHFIKSLNRNEKNVDLEKKDLPKPLRSDDKLERKR